jgi:predicted dehydrogenase
MTVNVGFLGAGLIATYHAKMLHRSGTDHRIAVVHDPDHVRASAFAEASGARVAASEDELLESDLDAVYVCTWTSEHPRLVTAAANRGLAVFCEKPLAVDLSAAVAVTEHVERSGVVNQVGLVLRDSPALLFLRHLLADEDNGRIMSVVFRDDQYLPTQGMYASTWRGDVSRAGAGTLLEHSIHDLDLLEWLAGPIETVSALTRHFHDLDGIEDLSVATLGFANGAVGSLTSVWHDVLARPSLRRIEVFCERAWFVLVTRASSRAMGSSPCSTRPASVWPAPTVGSSTRSPRERPARPPWPTRCAPTCWRTRCTDRPWPRASRSRWTRAGPVECTTACAARGHRLIRIRLGRSGRRGPLVAVAHRRLHRRHVGHPRWHTDPVRAR